MTKMIISLLITVVWFTGLQSQRLVSGPMLGYIEQTEACIWLQMNTECRVILKLSSVIDSSMDKQFDLLVTEATAYTCRFILTDLSPGHPYTYTLLCQSQADPERLVPLQDARVFELETLALWQYRHSPPDFSMAFGSCAYVNEEAFDRPGKPYGRGYEIFERIADVKPDAMIWLGDNTYFREPDWNTKAGMIRRYAHTRNLPELQRLLHTCAHYAIWDDHDFGPNDSNGSFIHKDLSKEVFDLFWANPGTGVPELKGITNQVRINDAELFLLDNRYYRTDHDVQIVQPSLLGKAQIEWLIQALKFSKSRFKVIAIGGQFLSDFAGYENYAMYPEERQYLLDAIERENIGGVIVLSGDRHHAELSRYQLTDGRRIYEFTSSPLTSGSYDHSDEPNSTRVANTHFGKQNFGLMRFSGESENRQVVFELRDTKGEMVWSLAVPASELYPTR